ncbi:hypothetical protein NE857_33920 (plasmid) [Nocardiopsis exhalans]|uniref:Protein CopB n=1 Tax=Nocardiopsis exhalans TaxID=163604 RepID=A0ABY5DJH1_9ACTN|nr:hypothetical protein [Nocardiopsis exhalans]USY23532.1 hypothetical protein NE857_33920 [Nocardiopsis exhalans]
MSTSGNTGDRPTRKGGRPNKGPRHPRLLRFKTKVNTALEKAAEAKGVSVQEYLDQLVEENVKSFMDDEEEQLMSA